MIEIKNRGIVLSICAQVLCVTVLTARWRLALESLFRLPCTGFLSLSFSFSPCFHLARSFLFRLSLSFPLSGLYSLLFLPLSHRYLNFFTSAREGWKWNKMRRGKKICMCRRSRRGAVVCLVPSTSSSRAVCFLRAPHEQIHVY